MRNKKSSILSTRIDFANFGGPFGGLFRLSTLVGPTSPIRNESKVGRNQLCLCGSGRKHKHCCGGK